MLKKTKVKTQLTVSLMVLTLMSCHILKKDKQTLRKLQQQEHVHIDARRQLLHTQNQLLITDSSHNDYTMVLWPKGNFKLSIANGFEGEAEKILLKGNVTKQKFIALKNEVKRDSSLLKANYSNETERITERQKNKLSTGYQWGWVLVLLMLLIVVWLYRRYRQ